MSEKRQELTTEEGLDVVSQEREFTNNIVIAARIKAIAAIPELSCLNTGHANIVRAVLGGLYEAVTTMKK